MLTSYCRYGDYLCLGENLKMPSFIDFMYATLLIFAAVCFLLNVVGIPMMLGCNNLIYIDNLLNPITIYRRGKVNKFGAALAFIFHNICFAPHALWFWVYKACTVGRPE